MAKDFLVETGNPEALDMTLQQMGAVLVRPVTGKQDEGYLKKDGYYVMRALSNPGFVRFACEQQGYCTIIRELEELV